MNYQKTRAFTLIELMVVIAIIGILASVVVPFVSKLVTSNKGGTKRAPFREEPAGPPERSPMRPSSSSVTLLVPDKVAAAELVNLATNQGYRVVWVDGNSAVLTR